MAVAELIGTSGKPDEPVDDGRVGGQALRRILAGVGVLAPLLWLAWFARTTVLSFDGGMNLQVSSSLADGHGLAWDYGTHVVSPAPVQTSGLFVFLGAAAIKIFGTGSLALQLTNLVFVAAFLAAVSYALRPWPVLRLVGPGLTVLITAGATTYSLSGYGEFAVGSLMVAMFCLLSGGVEGTRRPLLACAAASLLFGVSLSIKTISIAALPVLILGVVLVACCRPELSRIRLALSLLCCVPPIALFELYRAEQLGSFARWRDYWSVQLHGIGGEAASAAASRPGLVNASPGWPRSESLAAQAGTGLPLLLLVFLSAPAIALAISYVRRRKDFKEWLTEPRRAFEILLAGVVALYVPWYLFVSPLDWLRHFEVGWIAVSCSYLVLSGRAIERARQHATLRPLRTSPGHPLRVAAAVPCALLAVALMSRIATTNVRSLRAAAQHSSNDERAASAYVADLSAAGDHVCGIGVMSAPVVSLTSHVPLCDLAMASPCTGEIANAIETARAYLVWDRQARDRYPQGPPPTAHFTFVRVAEPSSYASIWRIAIKPGTCRKTGH